MKSDHVQLSVPLSNLVPSRRNPRKVKPAREAQQTLVALIRSQGLLQPLVVRPLDGKRYEVVAGARRLKALQQIHKDNGNPKIPCVLRNVDEQTADAMSLGENFGREAMHPLDEADAFAKLATSDGKDAAAMLGVSLSGMKSRVQRGRERIRHMFEECCELSVDCRGNVTDCTPRDLAAVPEDCRGAAVSWAERHPRG